MKPKPIISDQKLSSWWSPIARSQEFEQICILATCEAVKYGNLDEIHGATKTLELLKMIADSPPEDFKMPESGLIHEQPKKLNQ